MANEKISLINELNECRAEFGLTEKVPCSLGDNKKFIDIISNGGQLPQNIYRYKDETTGAFLDEFYYSKPIDLTPSEVEEYLTYKKLKLLKTIKNCAVFFTVLTIISLVVSFIAASRIADMFSW